MRARYAGQGALPRDLSGDDVLRMVRAMTIPAVLSISSQVAFGPVGNTAILPPLLASGVMPIALPTVILDFHPGLGTPFGTAISADALAGMLAGLETMGFLAQCRCVLTGYFASAAQVERVADFIVSIKAARDVVYICDPVIGDDGAPYVKQEIAVAIRDRLVPICDLLTPNVFELGWLTGVAVTDCASARVAAERLPGRQVVATSVPGLPGEISTVLFGDGAPLVETRAKRTPVPQGTGDVLAALLAGHIAHGRSVRECLAAAVDTLGAVLAASDGTVLNLVDGLKS
ncbi:pyridoxal kinase [soil metagenome]